MQSATVMIAPKMTRRPISGLFAAACGDRGGVVGEFLGARTAGLTTGAFAPVPVDARRGDLARCSSSCFSDAHDPSPWPLSHDRPGIARQRDALGAQDEAGKSTEDAKREKGARPS